MAAGDKETTSPEFESSALSSHFCAVECVVFFFSKSGMFVGRDDGSCILFKYQKPRNGTTFHID
jgi:hypothetical protein